jgi:hypothetical protein
MADKVKSEHTDTHCYAIMNILFVAIHSFRKDGSSRNKKGVCSSDYTLPIHKN